MPTWFMKCRRDRGLDMRVPYIDSCKQCYVVGEANKPLRRWQTIDMGPYSTMMARHE
jgi:hypothetical protein